MTMSRNIFLPTQYAYDSKSGHVFNFYKLYSSNKFYQNDFSNIEISTDGDVLFRINHSITGFFIAFDNKNYYPSEVEQLKKKALIVFLFYLTGVGAKDCKRNLLQEKIQEFFIKTFVAWTYLPESEEFRFFKFGNCYINANISVELRDDAYTSIPAKRLEHFVVSQKQLKVKDIARFIDSGDTQEIPSPFCYVKISSVSLDGLQDSERDRFIEKYRLLVLPDSCKYLGLKYNSDDQVLLDFTQLLNLYFENENDSIPAKFYQDKIDAQKEKTIDGINKLDGPLKPIHKKLIEEFDKKYKDYQFEEEESNTHEEIPVAESDESPSESEKLPDKEPLKPKPPFIPKKYLKYLGGGVILIAIFTGVFYWWNNSNLSERFFSKSTEKQVIAKEDVKVKAKPAEKTKVKSPEVSTSIDSGALEAPATEQISAEETAWDRAKRLGTVSSFEQFLRDYPNGHRADEAKTRIDNITRVEAEQKEDRIWQTARNINTESSYQSYLNEFPNGRYTTVAQQRLNDLNENAFSRVVSLDEYVAYMLSNRPLSAKQIYANQNKTQVLSMFTRNAYVNLTQNDISIGLYSPSDYLDRLLILNISNVRTIEQKKSQNKIDEWIVAENM